MATPSARHGGTNLVPAIHILFAAVTIKQDVDAREVKSQAALRAFARA
jgi:hypothetical protein